MKQDLIIVGVGATARRIYRFVKMYNLYNVIGFAVDRKYIEENNFMELPVYELENIKNIAQEKNAVIFVAVFWNNLNSDRKKIYERLKKQGLNFANIISPTAIIRGNLKGNNCWINDYVIVQSDAEIGNDVFIMDTALIGNEAVVKDHVFIAPAAKIGGGATIGEQSFVGINAIVFDDTNVGNRCIIGAGTAIKRNVSDNTVCKVSVENVIYKQYDENIIESKLKTNHNIR